MPRETASSPFALLQRFGGVIRRLDRFPAVGRALNRLAVDRLVSRAAPRPYPRAVWSAAPIEALPGRPPGTPAEEGGETGGSDAPPPAPPDPDYTTWPGLTDRRFTSRHLPAAPADHVAALPDPGEAAELFRRDRFVTSRSSVLFCFFAQWFTDSFLRTHPKDRRLNTSNHEIDLCQIYGLDARQADMLRERRGGRLRVVETGTGLYPPRLRSPDGDFDPAFAEMPYVTGANGTPRIRALMEGGFEHAMPDPDCREALVEERLPFLYASGLERGNSTILYAAISTIFVREHNRIAAELAAANPLWDDDRLFHTARCVNTVGLLRIVVEDYINHIANLPFRFRTDVGFAERRPWYRTNRIALEFNLLYRWHGLVPDRITLEGREVPSRDFRFNNALLERLGVEAVIAEASRQPAGRIGLANTPDFLLGAERAAIEMGRTLRTQPYNAYRRAFRRRPHRDFSDFTSDEGLARRLEALYGDVDLVELHVGLFADEPAPGAILGDLMRDMVAADAFSHALTNPLLSRNVYGPETFSRRGMEIIAETSTLKDLVARNRQDGGAGGVTAAFDHL